MTTTGEIYALAQAALDYEVARRVALSLKQSRATCLCEIAEPAEPEVGLNGVEPCWKQYIERYDDRERLDESKWCPTCRRRQRFHEAYRKAMKTRGARMRVMQRFALRGIDLKTIEREVKKHMADNDATETKPEGEEKPAEQESKPEGESAGDETKTE